MSGYVERLELHARLDDPGPAVRAAQRAAERGDESWRQWLAELEAGIALVVQLRIGVHYVDGDGRQDAIEHRNLGVWTLWTGHLPEYEAQLQEIASKDAEQVAGDLGAAGVEVTSDQIAGMAFHVTVEPQLHDRLVATGGAVHYQAGALAGGRPRIAPGWGG